MQFEFSSLIPNGERKPVTLIVALPTNDEIILASDTLALDGSLTPRDPFHKLLPFGPHVFASSGNDFGYAMYRHLMGKHLKLDCNIDIAAVELHREAYRVYESDLHSPKIDFSPTLLLAGFSDDDAVIYRWKFPEGRPSPTREGTSIGVGTLCELFCNYHTYQMTHVQRIQLSHFCVSLVAAKNSSCVKEPIDIGILKRGFHLITHEGTDATAESFLKPFREHSQTMISKLDSFFLELLTDVS
jgi:hypothetical protein